MNTMRSGECIGGAVCFFLIKSWVLEENSTLCPAARPVKPALRRGQDKTAESRAELSYGLLTLFDCDHDQGKNDKPDEHAVQFVKPGEDAAESLQPPEQPLDFIAFFIQNLESISK